MLRDQKLKICAGSFLLVLLVFVVLHQTVGPEILRQKHVVFMKTVIGYLQGTTNLTVSASTSPTRPNVLDHYAFSKADGVNDDLLLKTNCGTHRFNATLNFPLCTYRYGEDHLSSGLLSGGWDEVAYQTDIFKALEKNQKLQFIDLGANLGIYSLPIAHLGRPVLAVEANVVTAKLLTKSVYLGKIQDRMTVVFNAMSNDHQKLRLGADTKNKANSWLLSGNNCSGLNESATTPVAHMCANVVDTITLDDLLPLMKSDRAIMKADIQGAEYLVFNDKTASKFFDAIQMPYIQVEFILYMQFFWKDPVKRAKVDTFLRFFTSRNYTIHNPVSGAEMTGADWSFWPSDLIFKKTFK